MNCNTVTISKFPTGNSQKFLFMVMSTTYIYYICDDTLLLIVAGLVNTEDTPASLFEYPSGESAADYAAPADYLPVFASFEGLTPEQLAEIDLTCGDDKVTTLHCYTLVVIIIYIYIYIYIYIFLAIISLYWYLVLHYRHVLMIMP